MNSPIPTPVPGIFLYLKFGVEFESTLTGELQANVTEISSQSTEGYHCKETISAGIPVLDYQPFGDKSKILNPSVSFAGHLEYKGGVYLKFSAGIRICGLIDIGGYVKAGPRVTVIGHGAASFSYCDGGEAKAEFNLRLGLVLDFGMEVGGPLMEWRKWEIKESFWETETNLLEFGTDKMPVEFATLESNLPVAIKGADLKKILDLHVKYQPLLSFMKKKMRTVEALESEVFAANKYSFELVESNGPASFLVNSDGTLTGDPGNQEFEFKVRVTYTGSNEDYKIWKEVTLLYEPNYFTIQKQIEDGASKIASFVVNDMETEQKQWVTTGADGIGYAKAEEGHVYGVRETGCAQGYHAEKPIQQVQPGKTVTFHNVRNLEKQTMDARKPFIEDPSGFVYEGTVDHRLGGVTATLYYGGNGEKPVSNATENMRWDASAYDQVNPQITDALGCYMWNVPTGWWQVKYEKEGYVTVYSEWLPVPPVQTEVNIEMKSKNSKNQPDENGTSSSEQSQTTEKENSAEGQTTATPAPSPEAAPDSTNKPEEAKTLPTGSPGQASPAASAPSSEAVSTAAPENTKTPGEKQILPTTAPSRSPVPGSTAAPSGTKVKIGKKVKNDKSSDKNQYQVISGSTVSFVKSKAKKKVSVPAVIKVKGKTYKVTKIPANSFKKNSKLKKITLGANITTIGSNAFYRAGKLKKVIIKSSKVKKIGKNAFKGIYKKAVIVIPKKNFAKIKKMLRKSKLAKKVRIKKG